MISVSGMYLRLPIHDTGGFLYVTFSEGTAIADAGTDTGDCICSNNALCSLTLNQALWRWRHQRSRLQTRPASGRSHQLARLAYRSKVRL
ncbi:hypothetical protein FKM82_015933 [Ascaphus truei]